MLVLIHGLAGSGRSFERLVPMLADDHVAVDLPGHGTHAGTDGAATIEAMAQAVSGAFTDRATLVGHSMGGLVATALAASAPDRVERVVLLNAPPTVASRLTARAGGERALRMPGLGPVLWRALPDGARRNGLATTVAPGLAVPDVFVEDARRLTGRAFVRATVAVDAYLAEQSLHERVATLPMPVTVVFGERDRRVDPGSLDAYADVEVVRIPDAGHSPMWETPGRVAAVLA